MSISHFLQGNTYLVEKVQKIQTSFVFFFQSCFKLILKRMWGSKKIDFFNFLKPVIPKFPFYSIIETQFRSRIFEKMKFIIIFKKLNIQATIMIVAKSQSIILNSQTKIKSISQRISQSEQYIPKLSILVADYYFSKQKKASSKQRQG